MGVKESKRGIWGGVQMEKGEGGNGVIILYSQKRNHSKKKENVLELSQHGAQKRGLNLKAIQVEMRGKI